MERPVKPDTETTLQNIQINIRSKRMLLADWFVHLARESKMNLTQYSTSDQAFTLGAQNAFHIIAHFIKEPPFLNFVASDSRQQEIVDAIVPKAVGRVECGDFGGVVWYSTKLPEFEFKLSSPSIIGSFLQRLGSQRRILGWRKLGASIFLEFTEKLPADWDAKKAIFAPEAMVNVHIAAPGPCAGFCSSHVAYGVVETIGAICTFALGRPITIPSAVFPSKAEVLPQLTACQADHKILTLARNHISLDIYSPLATLGGFEVFTRARAALLTFDAAVRQERDSVACILYVVAAECLATPYTKWGNSKLTKRFIEFFKELMPTALDQIVAHRNFEEVFSIRRGERTARALRRDLLDRIYDYRSGNLHVGLRPSYMGLGVGFDIQETIRRGLFADFAEGAILRYIDSPRGSLIGHPAFCDATKTGESE